MLLLFVVLVLVLALVALVLVLVLVLVFVLVLKQSYGRWVTFGPLFLAVGRGHSREGPLPPLPSPVPLRSCKRWCGFNSATESG